MAIQNVWQDVGLVQMPKMPNLQNIAVQVSKKMAPVASKSPPFLRGYVSGLAMPQYRVEVPQGLAVPNQMPSQPDAQIPNNGLAMTKKVDNTPIGKAPVSAAEQFMPLFKAASKQYGVPLPNLLAVAQTESDFRPNLTSPTGVKGLMQVTQNTYNGLGFTGDRADPANSINAGAKLLSQLFSKYGNWDDAYYAYNGGHHAVTGIRKGDWGTWAKNPGKIKEIQNYAPKVNRYFQSWKDYFGE